MSLLEKVLVPVVDEADATATARALAPHDPEAVLAVHVVEKAGGAPDPASVEQRKDLATAAFTALSETFPDAETDIRYDTDVAEAIFDAAADHGASAIAFVPREGSRWIRLLTGDVSLDLVTGADRPVIALPRSASS